jgi:Protein of unknown function (DUF2510)
MSAPAWYPDPDGNGGQRYFDGTDWEPTAPAPPPLTDWTLSGKQIIGVPSILRLLISSVRHPFQRPRSALTCGVDHTYAEAPT